MFPQRLTPASEQTCYKQGQILEAEGGGQILEAEGSQKFLKPRGGGQMLEAEVRTLRSRRGQI